MSSPEQKPNKITVVEDMQKVDSNSSAGATADSEQKVENIFISQHSSKPNVVGSQCHEIQLECLKIAASFAGNVKAVEKNYLDLISLFN